MAKIEADINIEDFADLLADALVARGIGGGSDPVNTPFVDTAAKRRLPPPSDLNGPHVVLVRRAGGTWKEWDKAYTTLYREHIDFSKVSLKGDEPSVPIRFQLDNFKLRHQDHDYPVAGLQFSDGTRWPA